ncbi:hypothetical protein JW948_09900 [bacterium]|nr:hypothetical protein [bacterium]
MIVPMKKVTLLMSERSKAAALKALRKMGVLHVRHVKAPESEEIDALKLKTDRTGQAKYLLQSAGDVSGKGPKRRDSEKLVDEVLGLQQQIAEKRSLLAEKSDILRWFELWGDISPSSVRALRERGVFLRFYAGDQAGIKKLPDDKAIRIVKESGPVVYFVFFADSREDVLDFKEENLPEDEPGVLRREIREIEAVIQSCSEKLSALAVYSGQLQEYLDTLKKEMEADCVLYGMGAEEGFVYLQGYCPVDAVQDLKKAADGSGWGYMIQDAGDEDQDAPTLLRNPKWIRIIDPLFKFMGTFPGYHERDISGWFLLFLSLFYALLIGDAGYGLIFLGLTVFAQKKAGKSAPPEPFRLIYVMSTATVIWGVVTGTWFGYEGIADLPFLRWAVIDRIDSFAEDNTPFMMYICFIIGIVHLSLAHLINFFNMMNTPKAVAEIGWIGILWAIFFLVGTLVVGKPLPGIAMPLLAGGILLALVFSNYQKNIFKGIAATLFDLPLSVIGSFSDIMSYLRLFAVGFAAVQVASSFNDIAVGSGVHNVLQGLIAALVLLFGHSLNIVLGLMAVLVHGVRLNMLEFSSHLNQQWSGREYQPFRE